MKDKTFNRLVVAGFIALFISPLALGVLVAKFEADSYRKFCDAEVTTWDALWLDLRIDECKGVGND